MSSLQELSDFLQKKIESSSSLNELNEYLESISGIDDFFKSKKEFVKFGEFCKTYNIDSFSTNNREWGDIQTPRDTTDKICNLVKELKISPDVIIEPTYGGGNFILSSLEKFSKISKIYGIEIHKNYEWSFKAKLLYLVLDSKKHIPKIELFCENIFNHNFDVDDFRNSKNILIIGNPPWVTNTELSGSESVNLPEKNNFKKFRGIDAITGKSNFDLAEFIILQLLEIFSDFNGEMIMLCKNTVIKNLIKELPNYKFKISDIRSIPINSRIIFEKNVDASLLLVRLGTRTSDYTCKEISFEEPHSTKRKFGWVSKKFVSNVFDYKKFQDIDGSCCFNWRSGIKHDCAGILELTQEDNTTYNNSFRIVEIEPDVTYPLLKGSMLKDFMISKSNKKLIVTQKKNDEDTKELNAFPNLWRYLNQNIEFFKKRKSVVYKKIWIFQFLV